MTALVVNLTGVDPDDAFSVVPYIKGSTFLWFLEETVGGSSKYSGGQMKFNKDLHKLGISAVAV